MFLIGMSHMPTGRQAWPIKELEHLGLSPKIGESHFLSELLFFKRKTGILMIMSQAHGETVHVKFDGQMTVSSSTRNNIHSQVIYISSIMGSGLGPRARTGQEQQGWRVLSTHMCVRGGE